LTPFQRTVIKLRFGIGSAGPHDFEEISALTGRPVGACKRAEIDVQRRRLSA